MVGSGPAVYVAQLDWPNAPGAVLSPAAEGVVGR